MRQGLGNALTVQKQIHHSDHRGYVRWQTITDSLKIQPDKTAVVLTDLWDLHWCRGMSERTLELLAPINHLCQTLRDNGMLIVHAPSNVADYYAGTPARERALAVPLLPDLPQERRVYPALPIDDSDGGCDTTDNYGEVNQIVWTRQHEEVCIDQERDVIIDDEGERLYALLSARGIDTLLYTGVAVNMCVLNRSFGMKQMLDWGMRCVLVKDLTDSMYNPLQAPYVSHDQGTALVIDYIEKFVALTTTSEAVLHMNEVDQ